MKLNNFMLVALIASSLALPCSANIAVQTAAKATLSDFTKENLFKLYKARSLAKTVERREMVVKAYVAGLCAFGDMKNAMKINGEKSPEIAKPRKIAKPRETVFRQRTIVDSKTNDDRSSGKPDTREGNFLDSFTEPCDSCNGMGGVWHDCYTCKGNGSCPNAKCDRGTVIEIGFNGYRRKRNCPICGVQQIARNAVGRVSSVTTSARAVVVLKGPQ